MSNNHHHHHTHSHGNISLAFFMNLSFMVIELIAGVVTGSVAIISDSFHDFGDSLSLGVSWILESKKNKPADHKYPYGYKKLSIVGAIINIFVLIVAIFVSMYQAIQRLFNPEPIKTGIVIVVAIIGIVINSIPIIKMRKSKTISEKTVSLHLLEDVLGWVALLVVAVITHFTKWYFLDSYFAIAICIVLFVGIVRNSISIYHIIMDTTPKELNLEEIKSTIEKSNENILSVKEFKIRGVDGETYVSDISIVISPEFDLKNLSILYDDIYGAVEKFEIESTTIQIFINEN